MRPLGGYERLLSRKVSGTQQLALSHGASFLLEGTVLHDVLLESVAASMARHPLLRAYISVDSTGVPGFSYCQEQDLSVLARRVLRTVHVKGADFGSTWKRELENSLNKAELPEAGPLWRLANIVDSDTGKSAWVFCANHGIDDQQSINILAGELAMRCRQALTSANGEKSNLAPPVSLPFPPNVEDAVSPQMPSLRTLTWSLFQLCNSLRLPAMLPRKTSGTAASQECSPETRRTYVESFVLPRQVASSLRVKCRERGVTITALLSAAMLSVTAAAISCDEDDDISQSDLLLRFLLSVNLRPFGANPSGAVGSKDWAQGTVACAAGAVDYVVPVTEIVKRRGRGSLEDAESEIKAREGIWNLAVRCKAEGSFIIDRQQWVQESVRLFGLGMKFANVLKIVEMDAASGSLGRGYSCGVSNMGLVDFGDADNLTKQQQLPHKQQQQQQQPEVRQAFYATSHSRNGVLCQLSCMTTGGEGEFCGCLQFTAPIIPTEKGAQIARILADLLVDLSS